MNVQTTFATRDPATSADFTLMANLVALTVRASVSVVVASRTRFVVSQPKSAHRRLWTGRQRTSDGVSFHDSALRRQTRLYYLSTRTVHTDVDRGVDCSWVVDMGSSISKAGIATAALRLSALVAHPS